MGLAGGLNLYGFAAGDPVTFSDPFGLCKPGVKALSSRDGGNRTTIIVCADKTEEVRHGGTISWWNNNPGNLRDSEKGVGRVGGFAVFNTYEEGQDALWRLAKSDNYNSLTLPEFVHKYAPGKDGNDEAAYVSALVRAVRGIAWIPVPPRVLRQRRGGAQQRLE